MVTLKKTYSVYILTNATRVLYIGLSSNIELRMWQHKTKAFPGFSSTYNVNWLVYVEEYEYVNDAIARERQLKNWRREKKIALIESQNPEWHDLSMDWFPADIGSSTAIR